MEKKLSPTVTIYPGSTYLIPLKALERMLCGAAITGLTALMHIFARSMLRTALTQLHMPRKTISAMHAIFPMQL